MDVASWLQSVNQAGTDIQAAANALAQKISAGGDIAVRASNATTGAAVGAKAGSTVPVQPMSTQTKVLLGVGAYILLKKLL